MADQEQQHPEQLPHPRPTPEQPGPSERTVEQTTPLQPQRSSTEAVTDVFRRGLSQVTRSMPKAPPPPVAAAPVSHAIRERIHTLVSALDDQQHPSHPQAVNELVAIGDAAVPALNDVLVKRRSWLAAYRATEALGQIGDGRATGPLLDALRHPNSNVRWGAVRALAAIGDARALLDLRRLARDDRSKTSWGESVSGAAASAIAQMQSQNVFLRGAELVKTAIASVLMLVALILAWSVVGTVRTEIGQMGRVSITPLALPTATTAPTAATTATSVPEPTIVATALPVITGQIVAPANVRSIPSPEGEKLGTLAQGDEIIFLATNAERTWYKIRLGPRVGAGSEIAAPDATGWVFGQSVSSPPNDLPVEN